MGNFLSNMISLGVQGVFAYASAKQKAEKAAAILLRLTSGKEEVPIDEFLEMYDLRIYDFNSKQADIKFMKNHDFEGVYILHNLSRGIYHVGRSTKVLRKIDRTFRGYENQSVYVDWKNQNNFTVRIVRLCDSDFDNTILLERALVKNMALTRQILFHKIPRSSRRDFGLGYSENEVELWIKIIRLMRTYFIFHIMCPRLDHKCP